MNVLVIKTGAMGDVVRSSFVAQALKDKYKERDPKIYWITDKRAKSLFQNNPYVDYTIITENKFFLSAIKFDLVVNLEEDIENAKFTSSLKPKKILGVYYKEGDVRYTDQGKAWFDMSMVSIYGKKQADKLKLKNKKTHRQLIADIIDVNYKDYEPFLRLTPLQRTIKKKLCKKA